MNDDPHDETELPYDEHDEHWHQQPKQPDFIGVFGFIITIIALMWVAVLMYVMLAA